MIEGIDSVYKRINEIKNIAKSKSNFKPDVVKRFEDYFNEKNRDKSIKKDSNIQKNEFHPFLERLESKEDIDNPIDKDSKINDAIDKASNKYKVSKDLIKSIIKVESNFDPYAISKAGAMGLMQIIPRTSLELGLERPFDIYENIDAGVKYLRKMLDRYNNDLDKALAAYNAGPDNVDKAGGIPDIKETVDYVKKIKNLLFK